MSPYEAFLIHMEPRTLAVLEQLIWDRPRPDDDFVIETELMNLANEIRARLEKITLGITKVEAPEPAADWLSL